MRQAAARWLGLPHVRRVARLLLMPTIGLVAFLALTPDPPPSAGSGWDKLDHLAAFAGMGLLACIGFGRPRWVAGARWPQPCWPGLPLLALLAYGGFIEWAQGRIPGRSADLADLVADAAGLAIAMLLVALLARAATARAAAQDQAVARGLPERSSGSGKAG